ncbi:hypothetical protein [Chroococcus sp. FPU101]|uniref:hypothetical protein n=1 Tax=Chroococcus sp. FPU101 TaxID=1974212 RepID=UPI001A8E2650|nr:hypothetical protein [Chroococcus sp. FPU101]
MTTKKKLGGLGKLSQFSGIKATEPITDVEIESKKESEVVQEAIPQGSALQRVDDTPLTHVAISPSTEKLVSINIKITKAQRDWLGLVASQVRDNNTEPVLPNERVYPQHLIGMAIKLLKAAEVDWSQVRNVEELRKALNL